MKKYLLTCLFSLAAACVQAGMGLAELPGQNGDGLVTAGQDKWLAPRFHSGAIQQAYTPCERIADLATAGHGVLLSPPPPAANLGDIAADLLGDPPGFDRSVLPEVDRKITAFFRTHLRP
ncbi:hypothetical protein LP414_01745 [Polaromonas sp. P1(28)-13]|nr:hypothetical protein LP417_01820 [Polaromonas sp. P1-6]UUZ76474.1 hypothetical protein LP414_01745 [Polaromonas sp. P1(28)-13]